MSKLDNQSSKDDKSVSITGVSFATCCSGTKYKNRDDLVLIVLDPGSVVCGCFTVSTMPSAPVIWSRKNIKKAISALHKEFKLHL